MWRHSRSKFEFVVVFQWLNSILTNCSFFWHRGTAILRCWWYRTVFWRKYWWFLAFCIARTSRLSWLSCRGRKCRVLLCFGWSISLLFWFLGWCFEIISTFGDCGGGCSVLGYIFALWLRGFILLCLLCRWIFVATLLLALWQVFWDWFLLRWAFIFWWLRQGVILDWRGCK